MDPIPVPEPEPSAFNKQRPPSDLLRAQLSYFQHLQFKHGHPVDAELAQAVTTENGAARYIAHMTRLIREKALSAGKGTKPAARTPGLKIATRRKATGRPEPGLALAAAAEPAPQQAATKQATPPSSARQQSAPKGVTPSPATAKPAPRPPTPTKAASKKATKSREP